MIILPIWKKVGELTPEELDSPFGQAITALAEALDTGPLYVYEERSISDFVKELLPEGSKFLIDSVEVDGDAVDVRVTVRLPFPTQLVDVKINEVPLDPGPVSDA